MWCIADRETSDHRAAPSAATRFKLSDTNADLHAMETVRELVLVVLGLTLVLSVILPVAFFMQKIRGRSTSEAARFAGVGLGACFAVSVTFVLGVTAISAVVDPDNSLSAERDCERLGGEQQWFPDASGELGSICVVGGR